MEEEKKTQTPAEVVDGGVTEEQTARWKALYKGKISLIEVTDGGTLHRVWLRRPSIETLSASVRTAKTDEIKAAVVMYDNCFLGGSPEVREDGLLLQAAVARMGDMLASCTARLKNL